jgi:hypothetical protein
MPEVVVHRRDFNGRELEFVFAYASRKPDNSTVAHIVPVARISDSAVDIPDKTACDVKVGRVVGELLPAEHECGSCIAALEWRAAAAQRDRLRYERECERGEADALKIWRVHLRAGVDEWSVVTNGISPLLNSVIKEIPGRRWVPDQVCWLVPSYYGEELAESLRTAGAIVVVEQQASPQSLAGWLRARWTAGQIAELIGLLQDQAT